MARKTLSKEDLLAAWKKGEEELKSRRENVVKDENPSKVIPQKGTIMMPVNNAKKTCKNCKKSFYKKFPATEEFPESAEYCGCRVKHSLVDPNGHCECFA